MTKTARSLATRLIAIGLAYALLCTAPAQTSAPDGPPPFTLNELQLAPQTTWSLPEAPTIEAMNGTIQAVLQRCEISFTGAFGDRVEGFVPGADYPMIFIRDTSTLMQTATAYYPAERLATAIEEFLRRQYDAGTRSDEDGVMAGTGAISAVIAPDGHIDKATAVSDEETHLIHAAFIYYRVVGGPEWLNTTLQGHRIITRLNAALDWLLSHRLDTGTGLIKRAHTTDWGDVKLEAATNPTDIDPAHDTWTASIYDQALTYRAMKELAEMNQAIGDLARADTLLTQAAELKQRAQLALWQPEQGFFRTHVHLTSLEHRFDEDAMVSIANAVAVVCGLAEEDQARRIFDQLEQARIAAGASKPGVVLYPPYPAGTFALQYMAPGQYQNGALWDWWAGWQVLAEFEHGYATLAREHLAAIAADWNKHPGKVYEWQTIPDNRGFGPADYAGAAGTVGEAILSGLFGVHLDRTGLTLTPRLGSQPGFIRVYQPATGHYVAYRYTPRPHAIYIDYGTNAGEPQLAVMVPSGRKVTNVTVDGESIPPKVVPHSADKYCVVKTPPGIHRVVLALK